MRSCPVSASFERTGSASSTSRTPAVADAAASMSAAATLAGRIGGVLRLHALGVAAVELGEPRVVAAQRRGFGGAGERFLVRRERLVIPPERLERHREVVHHLGVGGLERLRVLEAEERFLPVV